MGLGGLSRGFSFHCQCCHWVVFNSRGKLHNKVCILEMFNKACVVFGGVLMKTKTRGNSLSPFLRFAITY